MSKPEAERAVVKMLDGTSKILLIAVHPDPDGTYPYIDLGNGNLAKLKNISKLNVPYYEEVKKKGLFN